MAVGIGAVAKDICLAWQIIIERAGVSAAAIVGKSGEAHGKIALPGAGGMFKSCVVGVAFPAVCRTGKILIMLGMASRSSAGTTARRRTVAGCAGGCRRGASPGRRHTLEMAVDVVAASRCRGYGLVKGAGAVLIGGGKW